jgi:hypothetical protein
VTALLAIFVDRTGKSTVTGRHRRSDQIIELLRSSGFEVLTIAGRNRGAGTIAYGLSCLWFYACASLTIWRKRPNLIWLPVPWPLIIPYTKSILVVDERDDYITNVAKKSDLIARILAFLSRRICCICKKVICVSAIEKDGDKYYLPTAIQREGYSRILSQKDLAPLIYPSTSRLGSRDLTKDLQNALRGIGLVGQEDIKVGQIVLVPFTVNRHTKFMHSNRISDVLSRGGLPIIVSDELPEEDAWFYPLSVTFEQLISKQITTLSLTVASVEYLDCVSQIMRDRTPRRWINFQEKLCMF